jgi:hypothetical protein
MFIFKADLPQSDDKIIFRNQSADRELWRLNLGLLHVLADSFFSFEYLLSNEVPFGFVLIGTSISISSIITLRVST